jgi:hypothetical protein
MTAALKWQTALAVTLAPGIAAFGNSAFGQTSRSVPRAAAIHECSTKAAKHKDYVEETTHIATYRACMAEHGQGVALWAGL